MTDDVEMLNKHTYIADNIIMHNGVVGNGEGDLSDTQCSVRDYAYVLSPYCGDMKILNILAELLQTHKSRWFIAFGEKCYKLGKWYLDAESKLWYSNEGYKPTMITTLISRFSNQNIDNWMRRPAVEDSKKIEMMGDVYAYQYCAGGDWSWDKWNTKPVVVEAEVVVPTETTDVFDSTGNIIGMVDSRGDVLWDQPDVLDEYDTNLIEDKFDSYICPECQAIQMAGDLIKGKCMFCGHPKQEETKDEYCPQCLAALFEDDIKSGRCPVCFEDLTAGESLWVQCPNCREKNYLAESTFNQGDTECLRCGALYVDTIVGKEAIVGWNEDTKKEHDDFMRVVMDKGNMSAAGLA